MELFTRNAQEKDAEGIVQVHVDCLRRVCSAYYTEDTMQKWINAQSLQEYSSWIKSAAHFLVVANKDDDIFAFAHIGKCSHDTFSSEMDYEVHKLYVSPDVARRGIGKKLLKELERRVSNDGASGIALRSAMNAVSFYEACGYRYTVDSVAYVGEAEVECKYLEKVIVSSSNRIP